MQRPLIVANWKMHKTTRAGEDFARLFTVMPTLEKVDIVLAPSFSLIAPIFNILQGTSLMLGAQDVHDQDEGAFTGEVSAIQLVDVGCRYVIIGHSERRQYFGETNTSANKKIHTALRHELIALYCVGESEQEHANGDSWNVVNTQIDEGLLNITKNQYSSIVIAYEPIWAIGTKKSATPVEVAEMHRMIREKVGNDVRILYGGSVTEENAPLLRRQPNVDGFLVGSASLDAETFHKICEVFE